MAAAFGMAGCGDQVGGPAQSPLVATVRTPSPRATTSKISPPTSLAMAGYLTILSDTTYPPQESIDSQTGRPVGFDVDLADALAEAMGLKARVVTMDFASLIPSLLAGQGDAIMSAMPITPERQKQVAFVAYFQAGQSILVRKGNPQGITRLQDLCGKTVAVQVTTPEEDTLRAENHGDCQSKTITIQTFPTDVDAIAKLKQGAADAAMDDSPVAAYVVLQEPDVYDLAGPSMETSPEGIGVDPKNGATLQAIRQAMLLVYSDGIYRQLLLKWNLQEGQIPAAQIMASPAS